MSGVAEANEESEIAAVATLPPPTTSRWAVFSHRNFTIFWLSMIVTNVGTWMAGVAEGWLITDLEPDRKSFYLGLISIAFAVPMLVLPPFGGVVSDRLPRLTGIRLTQIGFLIVNSSVAVLALAGKINVPVLVVAAFLSAVVLAFDSPMRHSIIPDLVPRDELTSAVSINAVAFSGAGLIGPAIAGLLIPVIGTSGVFVVNAISSVSVLIALRLLTGLPETPRERNPENAGAALGNAVRHLRASPILFGLFMLALVAGLFGRSYVQQMPVMSRDVYDVGSTANGILISAGGLGAMIGGLGLSAVSSGVRRRGRIICALVGGQAALLALLAAIDSYPAGVVTMLIMGACGSAAVALIMTLVQEQVAPQFRGRVVGFFLLTMISFPSAGSFLLGVIADRTTIQWGLAAFAAIVVASAAAVMAGNPAIFSTD
jgi:MFS family permease